MTTKNIASAKNVWMHRGFNPLGGMMRPVLAPENDSGGAASNMGIQGDGNSDGGGNDSGGDNNSGDNFDFSKFYEEASAEASGGQPSGSSADSQGNPPVDADQQQFQTEFTTALNGVQFGDLFNDDIAKQINEGDLTGANKAFKTQLNTAVQQSVRLNAMVIQRAMSTFRSEMQNMVNSGLTNDKQSEALIQNFPAAKDPALRPTIQGIYEQSLKHTKGKIPEAVEMAKGMLKFMGGKMAGDMGLNVPPSATSNNIETTESRNLVRDLLGKL